MATFKVARFDETYLFSNDSWNRDEQNNIVLGQPVNLSYTFVTSFPSYYDFSTSVLLPMLFSTNATVTQFNTAQRAVVQRLRDTLANYAGINLDPAIPGLTGAITFGNSSVVRIFNPLTQAFEPVQGVGFFPNINLIAPTTSPLVGGDIWINSNGEFATLGQNPLVGNYGQYLLLHELGHALGLAHDGVTGGGASSRLPKAEANLLYTAMANPTHDYVASGKPLPITPMMYDIAQLQRLYGANSTYNNTATTYSFGDNTHPFAVGVAAPYTNPGRVLMTLWDAGGIDEIDASSVSTRVLLDLRPGAFSSIGLNDLNSHNVGIALGAVIENAKGGSAADFLVGNHVINNLNGGDGQDTLDGGLAADAGIGSVLAGQGDGAVDTLAGGLGRDTYILHEGGGVDHILDAGPNLIIFRNLDNDDIQIVRGTFIRAPGPATMGQNAAGTITFTMNSPLTLTEISTGTEVVIDDFQDGDLGINIRDAQAGHTYANTATTITGDETPNTLSGTAGADLIQAFGGNDTVNAGADDDILEAGDGADFLYGEAGFDRIYGGAGTDQLYGGDDDDELYGGTNDDILEGGAGYDNVAGEYGRDIVVGNEGDDELSVDAQFDLADLDDAITAGETQTGSTLAGEWLDGGEGEDVALGQQDNDLLAGGGGADVLVGGGGDDNLLGDDERDLVALNWSVTRSVTQPGGVTAYQLVFSNSSVSTRITGAGDEIYGGAGSDWVHGQLGDDYIDGGAGNDVLFGDQGFDAIFGGSGDDVIGGDEAGLPASEHGDDYLDGEDGNDTLYGDGGSDEIYGGIGNDQLHGDNSLLASADQGSDYLDGEAGDDTLVGYGGDDVLIGDQGNDQLFGGEGSDDLDGGTGIDVLDGGAGDDVLAGGDFGDTLVGGAGDDQIDGEGGVDSIEGGDGADILFGGVGADRLQGGSGNDELDGGDDDDIIIGDDTPPSAQGNDVLSGGAGNDQLAAGGGADSLDGGDGFDELYGEAGDDFLAGGADDDLLWGDADNTPLAEQGNDYLSGGDGNDQLVGYAGADTLDGGAGNDTMFGDTGNDTYIFGRGYGADYIVDDEGTAGNADRIEFAADISPDEVAGSLVNATSLVLTIFGTTDQLTIEQQFSTSNPNKNVEYIAFADGTVWTTTPMLIKGTAAGNFLNGTVLSDVIEGLAGNDVLQGGQGGDRYRFYRGDGVDQIIDSGSPTGADDKILYAPDILPSEVRATRLGNDLRLTLTATGDVVQVSGYFQNDGVNSSVVEQIKFVADGTTWDLNTVKQLVVTPTAGDDTIIGYAGNDSLAGLAGSDSLTGNAGTDTLDGGIGNDSLQGGLGNDTYVFARGDGQDTVNDVDSTAGNIDRIVYAADIQPSEVAISRSSNDLLLSLAGTTDQVRVTNWFLNDGTSSSVVERIEFLADGTFWDVSTVKAMALAGTSGPDQITGYATNDLLAGLAGNDTLTGNAGGDTLDGGTGNDSMLGGTGNDTYRIFRGDGVDVVTDQDSTAGNVDTVLYASDILPSDIQVARAGNNLGLTLTATGDQVAVTNYFENDGATPYLVERIEFQSNGTVWDLNTVKSMVLAATNGNDSITGFGTADVINGLGGNDTLRGASGDDTLDGGIGNDTLYGENGSDTYLYAAGWGQDTIFNADSDAAGTNDVLQFASGITPASVTRTKSGNDLVLTRSPDQVTLKNYFLGDTAIVEQIKFADGTIWTEQTIGALFPITGTSGNDNLIGTGLSENITGLTGNDTVTGQSGNDTIDGGAGADSLFGGAGNDVLIGGAESGKNPPGNWLYGDTGNDILIGGSGADSLVEPFVFDENNLLFGAAGADNLQVSMSDDLIIGGTGDDVTSGQRRVDGNGHDVYLYNKGDGADRVVDLSYLSTLSIGGGARYSNLSFQVSGLNLLVKVGTSTVTLVDWYHTVTVGVTPYKRISTLQMVIEGTQDYNASSPDPMKNRKVQAFDFLGLVAAFDAAGGSFNVANNLAAYRLWGSDTQALGGAVAYQYARTGSISALTYDQMRAILAAPEFAVSGQSITAGAAAMSLEGGSGEPFAESAFLAADAEVQAEDASSAVAERQVTRDSTGEAPTPLPIGFSSTLPAERGIASSTSHSNSANRGASAPAQMDNAVAAVASASLDLAGSASGNARPSEGIGNSDGNASLTLQHLIDAIGAFDEDTDGPDRKKKSLQGVSGSLVPALAESAGLSSWAVTNALLQYHLAGADDSALGGDQANWGKNDALSGFNLTVALDDLTSGSFGAEARQLRPLGGLKEGYTKLA